MKTPAYWKAYRLKNLDKLRAYKRAHEKRRRVARKTPLVPVAQAPLADDSCAVCGKPSMRKGWHNGVVSWLCQLHA